MDEDRTELARLQKEWMSAMQQRDQETLERIVADGFRFTAIHLGPEPMTREQWMGAAMGGYDITSFTYLDMDVDVFGDTGIVYSLYSQVAHYNMVDLTHMYRLTDVWSRIDDRWQVVARHSSILG